MQDIVRVFRIVEYTGPRGTVETVVSKSIHGERICSGGLTIRVTTLGLPTVLAKEDLESKDIEEQGR